MAKVDWITWKTDTKEIVDPKKVKEKFQECFTNYNTYMNPVVYEQIKYEVNNGGLKADALSIMGVSPAHEMAVDILNKIDEIKKTANNLSESMEESIKEQKQTEKKQLIEAIENKIAKEKAIIENVEFNEKVANNIIAAGVKPEDVINIINDRIKKLTERLERAKSL